MMMNEGDSIGINQCLSLPKTELNTKTQPDGAVHRFHRQIRQRVGGTPVSWKNFELFFKLGGTLGGETPVS